MTRMAIADAAPSIVAGSQLNTALDDSADTVLEQVFAEADALLARSGLEHNDIHHVVASIPAPVDFANGVTGHSHIMSGWEGFPLRAAVLKELGLDVGGGRDGSEAGQLRSLVKSGDRRAGAVLRDAASRLGELTAALVDMFNSRTVVVGGELVGLGDDVLASLRGVVYQEAMPIATRNLVITVAPADRDLAINGGAMAGAQRLLG